MSSLTSVSGSGSHGLSLHSLHQSHESKRSTSNQQVILTIVPDSSPATQHESTSPDHIIAMPRENPQTTRLPRPQKISTDRQTLASSPIHDAGDRKERKDSDTPPSKSSSSDSNVRKLSDAEKVLDNYAWGLESLCLEDPDVCPPGLKPFFDAIKKEDESVAHRPILIRLFDALCVVPIRCCNENFFSRCFPVANDVDNLRKKGFFYGAFEGLKKLFCCRCSKSQCLEHCCAPCWPRAEKVRELVSKSWCNRFNPLYCCTRKCLMEHSPDGEEVVSLLAAAGQTAAKTVMPEVAVDITFELVKLSAIQGHNDDNTRAQNLNDGDLRDSIMKVRDEYTRVGEQFLKNHIKETEGGANHIKIRGKKSSNQIDTLKSAIKLFRNFVKIETKLAKNYKMHLLNLLGEPRYKEVTKRLFGIVMKIIIVSGAEKLAEVGLEGNKKFEDILKEREGIPAEIEFLYNSLCEAYKSDVKLGTNLDELRENLQEAIQKQENDNKSQESTQQLQKLEIEALKESIKNQKISSEVAKCMDAMVHNVADKVAKEEHEKEKQRYQIELQKRDIDLKAKFEEISQQLKGFQQSMHQMEQDTKKLVEEKMSKQQNEYQQFQANVSESMEQLTRNTDSLVQKVEESHQEEQVVLNAALRQSQEASRLGEKAIKKNRALREVVGEMMVPLLSSSFALHSSDSSAYGVQSSQRFQHTPTRPSTPRRAGDTPIHRNTPEKISRSVLRSSSKQQGKRSTSSSASHSLTLFDSSGKK